MKIIIIGNGIVALSCAFHLVSEATGVSRVVLVGKRDRLCSASLAAAAMLNSFAEIEAGTLEAEVDKVRFQFSRDATAMWPAFAAKISSACRSDSGQVELERGTYVVNNCAADNLDDDNFDAIERALSDFEEPYSRVNPKDIPNYNPTQRGRATRALLIDNEGWMNPRQTVAELEAALVLSGRVDICDQMASKLILGSDGAIERVVLTDGSSLEGDKFLVATGAATSELIVASDIGLQIQRVFYGVGVSIEIACPTDMHTNCIRTPNRGLACGLYSAPYRYRNGPNDRMLIGASNFISPTPYLHGRLTSVETLMRGAIDQINANFYRADLIRVNVGWRPTSQDTYPLIGTTSICNLVIATGTKRDGFHLAPLLAKTVSAMLMGHEVGVAWKLFRPERQYIRTLTRQEAIEKAVRHQMSAAYQHGFEPAHNRMSSQVSAMFRDSLEKLHDDVGAFDWGIPPEMLDMYRYRHASV